MTGLSVEQLGINWRSKLKIPSNSCSKQILLELNKTPNSDLILQLSTKNTPTVIAAEVSHLKRDKREY